MNNRGHYQSALEHIALIVGAGIFISAILAAGASLAPKLVFAASGIENKCVAQVKQKDGTYKKVGEDATVEEVNGSPEVTNVKADPNEPPGKCKTTVVVLDGGGPNVSGNASVLGEGLADGLAFDDESDIPGESDVTFESEPSDYTIDTSLAQQVETGPDELSSDENLEEDGSADISSNESEQAAQTEEELDQIANGQGANENLDVTDVESGQGGSVSPNTDLSQDEAYVDSENQNAAQDNAVNTISPDLESYFAGDTTFSDESSADNSAENSSEGDESQVGSANLQSIADQGGWTVAPLGTASDVGEPFQISAGMGDMNGGWATDPVQEEAQLAQSESDTSNTEAELTALGEAADVGLCDTSCQNSQANLESILPVQQKETDDLFAAVNGGGSGAPYSLSETIGASGAENSPFVSANVSSQIETAPSAPQYSESAAPVGSPEETNGTQSSGVENISGGTSPSPQLLTSTGAFSGAVATVEGWWSDVVDFFNPPASSAAQSCSLFGSLFGGCGI